MVEASLFKRFSIEVQVCSVDQIKSEMHVTGTTKASLMQEQQHCLDVRT
jgi:hypothetical protein